MSNDRATAEPMTVRGRVWSFGDDISTDLIMPGPEILASQLRGKKPDDWVFHAIRPGWSASVEAGDIIVAGRNFGCGSGRIAPTVLRRLGIAGVVADSVARTFFRNAVAAGLPAISCAGVRQILREGDEGEIEVDTGMVRNTTRQARLCGHGIPPDSPPGQILRADGIQNFMRTLIRLGPVERSAIFGLRPRRRTSGGNHG